MGISRSGDFSVDILAKDLVRGLRPSKNIARDTKYLVECTGAFGRDGILKTLDALTRFGLPLGNDTFLTTTFPYPQIFVLNSVIIVCTATKIYEVVNGLLVLKITVTTGTTWSIADYYNFIYMSNGVVSVVRDGLSMVYSTSAVLPPAQAICDFNGQVIISTLGLPV